MATKGSERVAVFPVGYYVAAAMFTRFTAVAMLNLADGGDTASAQLYKALDANGTGAVPIGDPVVATVPGSSPAANDLLRAAADIQSDQLGRNDAGVYYTHVAAIVGGGSPEVEQGVLLAFDARYSEDTLAGSRGQLVKSAS